MSLTIYSMKEGMKFPYPEGTLFVYCASYEIAMELLKEIGEEHVRYQFSNARKVNPFTVQSCCLYRSQLNHPELEEKMKALAEALKPVLMAEKELSSTLNSLLDRELVPRKLLSLSRK